MKFYLYKWKGSSKNPVIHPYLCGQSLGLYGRYPLSRFGITLGFRWGPD